MLTLPLTRDLVLVGGGHAHALVLLDWAIKPMSGVRLTLINPEASAPYTGMLPGHIAGHYPRAALEMDLVRLARHAGARLVLGRAEGLDPKAGRVMVAGRPPVGFDVVSVDIGITSDLPGFNEHAMTARPLGQYAERWEQFVAEVEAGQAAPGIAVLGAGVAGVELALAMDHRLRAYPGRHITLIEQGAALPRLGAAARHRLLAELAARGITLMTRTRVEALEPGAVRLADGRKVTAAFILSAAGGRAQGWLQGTGLPLHDGFITVDAFLRAQAHPQVFAVGDCAHLAHAPRPKAGVFAVRQAPVLAHNLRSTLAGGRLKRYDPQRDYLKLISLGSRAALADKWGLPLRGRWLWTLKDRIDRRFMRMFHSLPAMPAPAIPAPAALGMAEALGEAPLCAGCGAKVGPDPLHKALAALPAGPGVGLGVGLELGTGGDAAVLRHGAHLQVIATGHLRALTEDPYLMARIAAIHALGDVWAMGAAPQLALASLTLPRLSDSLLERSLHEIVAGAGAVFSAAGAVIAGGHTSIGAELVIGFTVTGTAQGRVLTKAGAQAGDRLILTKPLGSGTLLAAEMLRKARGADIAALWPFLQQPQGAASAILAPVAHAMTDIAGFGLAGHLDEMLRASGLCARITLADLPLFQGAEGLAARGVASSLEPANRAALAGRIDTPDTPRARLLFDPQTAGGLLAAVPEARAEATCAELAGAGYTAAVIGTTLPAAGQSAIIARPM